MKNESFIEWLKSVGKSEKTAKNYHQAVAGSISNWAIENHLIDQPIIECADYREFSKISKLIFELEIFNERNTKGKGMYSAALRSFGEFLEETTNSDLAADIEEITQKNEIADTQKTALINARLGQGKFRQELIELWQGCAVTGYGFSPVLVASHIKPWSDSSNSERLDPYNGLLLLPNIDKVFDRHYISFDTRGKILISPELEDPETIGIAPHLKIQLRDEHQAFMEHHRARLR